jgi:ATP-binding cassette subfamily B protein
MNSSNSNRADANSVDSSPVHDLLPTLSAGWQPSVQSAIRAGERVLAYIELDLDAERNFAQTLLVLTNLRLIECGISAAGMVNSPKYWELSPNLELQASVLSGLGRLELLQAEQAKYQWPFTSACESAADRFAAAFASIVRNRALAASSAEAVVARCASCGAVLQEDQPTCPSCTPSAAPSPSASLMRLLPFAKRRARTIIAGMLLTIASTAAAMVPPYLIIPLMDRVLVPLQRGDEVPLATVSGYWSALACAAVVAWLLGWARTYVLALASEQVSCDIRNETYSHLQKLSLEYYGGRRTGDLISRISSDTDRICNFLSLHMVDFVSDVLMFVFTAIVLLRIDPVLALAALIPFPFIAWLIQKVRIHLRHGFARATNAWSDMVSVLTDAIPGVRVVKAFAQEQREIARFAQANRVVYDSNVKVTRLWAFFGPTVTFLTEIGTLIIWAFGAWRVATGDISVGVLTGFLAYISRFYVRLDSMSGMLANTQRAAASTHRIFEILDRQPVVMEPTHPVAVGKLSGEVTLTGVRFKYGSREVLRGIDMRIEPGELVGVVGPSGSGKSTLVNLVCRFYDPTQGKITAGGVDIRSFPVEKYRRNIGIVLQEPYLFFGTIADNITYGRPNANRAEIIEAHNFIVKLPDGYDSIVGERGQTLSGGERQRISIARALLTDPSILILDEATSAVDNETEREIQNALDNLIRGRTTIAIAHRLSTLRNANRIFVLEAGRVVEVGKHQELLDRGGVYSRLYHAQLEPKSVPSPPSPTLFQKVRVVKLD